MTRFLLLLSCFLFLGASSINATTWKSRSFGFWNSASTWEGFQVPVFQQGDSLLILHPVSVQSDLEIPSSSYVRIETEGGLCGHYTFTILSSSKMENSGIFNMDSFVINGAKVYNYAGGFVTLTNYAQLTGTGAIWSIQGGWVHVGGWFNCPGPGYLFANTTGLEDLEHSSKTDIFYPNPSSGSVSFSLDFIRNSSSVFVYNSVGVKVLETAVSPEILKLDLPLPSGVYQVVVKDGSTEKRIRLVIRR